MNKYIQAKLNKFLNVLLAITIAFTACSAGIGWMFDSWLALSLIVICWVSIYAIEHISFEIMIDNLKKGMK